MNNIYKAIKLAKNAHKDQYRIFNQDPYFFHLGRVATLVSISDIADETTISAAWCHDVLEDTSISYQELSEELGKDVADLVLELTNKSVGLDKKTPREEKKKADREHLKNVSTIAKRIKLRDRFDNISEILHDLALDPNNPKILKFAQKYTKESFLLIDVLKDADIPFSEKLEDKVTRLSRRIDMYLLEYNNNNHIELL